MTTVLKTEVWQGQAQVRDNPLRLIGYPKGGYQMAANTAPTMTVITEKY